MKWMIEAAKRLANWVWHFSPPWIVDTLLSITIVGLAATYITNYVEQVAKALEAPPSKTAVMWLNDYGQTEPFDLLVTPIEEEKSASITFEPPELRQAIVCEFAQVSGHTHKELLVAYLDKFSMCFLAIERVTNEQYSIRPNLASNQMTKKNDRWMCLC